MSASKPTLSSLLSVGRLTREHVEDFDPTVVYAPEDSEQAMIAVLEGADSVQDALRSLLAEMRETLGPPAWIALTLDSYAKAITDPDWLAQVGHLQEAFEGGDPQVTEQLVVMVVDAKRHVEAVSQTYRYTPVEGWEWDSPDYSVTTDGGVLQILLSHT